MTDISYTLIRSDRKSLVLQIDAEGKVVVRAPLRLSGAYIDRFVNSKRNWIIKKLAQREADKDEAAGSRKLTDADIRALAKKAKELIPERVRLYAPKVGVDYGRITIRNQRTRWGSCSGKGNLNFNCLLMLTPLEVIDSVVVHELCHRKEMNHSQRFYAEVRRVYPEYDKWNRWLKKNGRALMNRMTCI